MAMAPASLSLGVGQDQALSGSNLAPGSTGFWGATVQAPDLQVPLPQGVSQAPPLAMALKTQPCSGSQPSVVQALPSWQGTLSLTHLPALQTSCQVHLLASGQGLVLCT